MTLTHSRRALIAGLGVAGLAAAGGCATAPAAAPAAGSGFVLPRRAPMRMEPRLITHITVCSRPFRAAGPRLDVEALGDKRLVHNYGHGGSGWSLAWGSSTLAVDKAMQGGTRDVAVIGCGALGLTSAILAQRAGARTTIYAAERTPQTRSARATGVWSPDSRIADAAAVDKAFPALWEAMARTSYAMHRSHVGRDGDPVFWQDTYFLRDKTPPASPPRPAGAVDFATYGDRVRGLIPRSRALAASENPFPVGEARLGTQMVFNVTELSRQLTEAFLREGGRIVTRTFATPADLAALAEPVVINCTGYGARALFGDTTVTPVRGQIAWLVPQPAVDYGLYYRGVSVVPRPDGVVVQQLGGSDMWGYGIDDETPDPAEAEAAIATVAPLFV